MRETDYTDLVGKCAVKILCILMVVSKEKYAFLVYSEGVVLGNSCVSQ